MREEPLLRVVNLSVDLKGELGRARIVRNIDFQLPAGKTVALVGESGCGKTITARALLRLLPPNSLAPSSGAGQLWWYDQKGNSQDLCSWNSKRMSQLRGREIAMIFQDPSNYFNPVLRLSKQVGESLQVHQKLSTKEVRQRMVEMLMRVHIDNAAQRLDNFPHQFSGGMLQRAMVAAALICHPRLLIADEPTTALDVTIQAQVLALLQELQGELGMAVLLITHDLGVVAQMSQYVMVMYGGVLVEQGSLDDIFYHPAHPYSAALIRSVPKLAQKPRTGKLYSLAGSPPDPYRSDQACPFAPRCRYAMRICQQEIPPVQQLSGTQAVRCWLHQPQALSRLELFQQHWQKER